MAEKEPTTKPGILAIQGIASPEKIEKDMIDRVRDHVVEQRMARGEVHRIEDTFPLQRALAGASDYLRRYERAVKAVRAELDAVIEEEAADGGNHYADGQAPLTAPRWNGSAVPAANVTVPDEDGDWHLTRQFDRSVDVEWLQVLLPGALAAARAYAQGEIDKAGENAAQLDEEDTRVLEEVATAVLRQTLADLELTASKLSPKTTGLDALAAMYSRAGDDQTASVIASAVRKASKYKGVKVERA